MKNGFHKHDGYPRAHPVGQKHSDIFHFSEQELEANYGRMMDIYKAQDSFQEMDELFGMLNTFEKHMDTIEVLDALDELIILMMVEGVDQPEHNQARQEVIDGDHEGEPEPNPASGLP